MDISDRQLHCDEFYCGFCKQIYPSHLGIPWYGRLDCPWCHDCTKNGVACTICANLPPWPNTSMAVKRVCKVNLTMIEAAIGESISYSQVGTVYENITAWLEPYKKKSVGARLNKVANADAVAVADAVVNDAIKAVYTRSFEEICLAKILSLHDEEDEQTSFTAHVIPPPLDVCAPELDCLSHKQHAPLAHTSLSQDASWSINKIE